MARLALTQGGVEHPVYQYPMPIKGAAVALSINGQASEGRVTSARGRVYTYFQAHGGEFYVAGELAPDTNITFSVPDGFVPKIHKPRADAYVELKAKRQEKIAAGEVPAPKPRGRRKSKAAEEDAALQAKAGEQWGANQQPAQ